MRHEKGTTAFFFEKTRRKHTFTNFTSVYLYLGDLAFAFAEHVQTLRFGLGLLSLRQYPYACMLAFAFFLALPARVLGVRLFVVCFRRWMRDMLNPVHPSLERLRLLK